MEEIDDIALENLCADFVSADKFEPILLHLLVAVRAGQWWPMAEICHEVESDKMDLKDLFVSWLPDPAGNDGYSLVLFYHTGLLWSTTALYNRERLLAKASSSRQASMANKRWFSARILFTALTDGQQDADPLCEESIILVLAENEGGANQEATEQGLNMEHSYLNQEGESIEWKLLGVLEVQDLCETLESGTEVFSHMFLRSHVHSKDARELLENTDQGQICSVK